MSRKSSSYSLQLLTLFLLNLITARVGLMMDAINGVATLVWPPTGIALAALILFGNRLWPAIFFASFCVNSVIGIPITAALGIACGSTLEAVVANYLLQRRGFSPDLSRVQDAVGLVVFGALVGPFIGASIGVTSLWFQGVLHEPIIRSTWLAWWTGDAMGALIIAPLLLAWNIKKNNDVLEIGKTRWEVAIFGLSLTLISFILFSKPSSFLAAAPLPLIVFPIAIWTALRFGTQWSTRTVFVICVAAVLATTLRLGPFAKEPLSEGLALLHFFLGAVAVTCLILVAAVSERVHAKELARENEERTSAQERIRSILNSAHDAFISMDEKGAICDWNPQAEQLFGWSASEAMSQRLGDLIIPERFRDRHDHGLKAFLKSGVGTVIGKRIEMPALHRTGKEIPIELTISAAKHAGGYVFNAFLHDISYRIHVQRIQSTRLAFAKVLNESPTVTQAFARTAATLGEGFGFDCGRAWLLNEKTQSLVLAGEWRQAKLDQGPRGVGELFLGELNGAVGAVWEQNELIWISDLATQTKFNVDQAWRGVAAFPIVANSEVVGVIEFLSRATLESDPTIIAAMSDIIRQLGLFTQRKRAEEKSRQSDERYRHFIEAVQDYAIIMLDDQGYVTSWNSGAEKIFGYTSSEIIGKHFSLLYPPGQDSRIETAKELEFARLNGRAQLEGVRIRKSGSQLYANVTVTPLYDANGDVYGFSKITRDVTERRMSEEKLKKLRDELERRVEDRTTEARKREKQLQMITDALPTIVSEIDAQGRFLFVNEACRKWFESKSNELIGMKLEDVFGVEDFKSISKFVRLALSGKEIWFEHEAVKGNKKIFFAVSFIPEFNEAGEPNGFISVATDVTKHYEAKESAEAASKAKSAFLANMSHEIRTPLGAVLGFSDLIANQNLTPSDRSKYVAAIKRNGELLSNIISDILDISKVEADKLEVEKQSVPLVEVLTDITTMLSLQAQEKGLRLTVSSDGPIPQLISTDPLRLRQIIINVVGNAIKFTERGYVEVKIRQILDDDDQHKIAFEVRDSGNGIEASQAAKLFRPFMQADASTKRKHGGTGLGLVLSKKLANLLGGDVVLSSSQIGAGSTFTITVDPGVPAQSYAQDLAPKPVAHHEVTPPRANEEVALNGVKVLLVEDAPDNQMLIGRFLKVAGAEVDIANNGQEALHKAQSAQYDVLLMDLQMPIMDGYEATNALRKSGYQKPIIALTAHALKEERQRCLASGFNDHVSKPINRAVLLDSILSQCNRAAISG